MARDSRRYWYLVVPVLVIWALAVKRIGFEPTPVSPLLFNWTPSLPYRVAYADYRATRFERGDFVLYAFEGPAAASYPGLAGQPFFKRIAGVEGGTIEVQDRHVFVNGEYVGWAKPRTFDQRPLDPIDSTAIPAGYLYVQGTAHDSFDSRYRQSGLVRIETVKAKVTPLL